MKPLAQDAAETAAREHPRSLWSRLPLPGFRLAYLTLLTSSSRGGPLRPLALPDLALLVAALQPVPRRPRAPARVPHVRVGEKRVPGYRQFLDEHGHVFRLLSLENFPETTKENYADARLADRCRNGRIPVAGPLVDQSAGSSGTPYNWVRSAKGAARRAHQHRQLGALLVPTEPLFALNAFSMGPGHRDEHGDRALARLHGQVDRPRPRQIVDHRRSPAKTTISSPCMRRA